MNETKNKKQNKKNAFQTIRLAIEPSKSDLSFGNDLETSSGCI